MSVASLSAVLSPGAAPAAAASGDSMGKDDFLKLLVAQLQNQDPLSPQDPTEFTSQLTQYSSLEQLLGVNENLQHLISTQSVDANIAAAGFIGKIARVNGDQITVTSGGASAIRFELPYDSVQTNVNVYDAGGALVRMVNLGQQSTGEHDFQWDGLDSNGVPVADGSYSFGLTAQDANGSGIPYLSSISGTVTGVHFDRGQTLLTINGVDYPLSELFAIEGGT